MKKSTTSNFSNLKLNNRLYQYKGGGYDGCFWEWNLFMFDKNGKFINIYTSGHAGIKTKKEAIALIKNNEIEYRYNLNSHKHLLELGNESNAGLVEGIQTFFSKNDIDIQLICNCKICKNEVNVDECVATDPSSDGGIVVSNKSLVCDDCYSDHSCPNCGEYADNIELYYLNNDTKCEYCISDEDKIENLQYFLTVPNEHINIEDIIEKLTIEDLKHIRLDEMDITPLINLVEDNELKEYIINKQKYQMNYYNPKQLNLSFNYISY